MEERELVTAVVVVDDDDEKEEEDDSDDKFIIMTAIAMGGKPVNSACPYLNMHSCW